MAGDTVECYNCGNQNPAWAQVCRSCGTPIRPGRSRRPEGPLPTDRESLIAIGTGIGAILLAVIVGVIVSGMIPVAPVASAKPTPTPSATQTPRPTTPPPSIAESVEPTPAPTPELIGTIAFGTSRNGSGEITSATNAFTTGTSFCHSISLNEPFGVDQVFEEVLSVGADGTLAVVQPKEGLPVQSGRSFASYCASSSLLINSWGVGDFILRDYRGTDAPELVAEAPFSFSR